MDLPPVALISGLEKFPAEIHYPAPLLELWRKCTQPKTDNTSSSGYHVSLNPYIYHLMEVQVIERLISVKSCLEGGATPQEQQPQTLSPPVGFYPQDVPQFVISFRNSSSFHVYLSH